MTHRHGYLPRYVAVGVLAAAGYLAVGWILSRQFGFSLQVSNVVAIVLMHPVSYLGHRYFTFQYAGAWWPSIRRFLVVAVLSTLCASAATAVQDHLHVPALVALSLNCVVVPLLTVLALRLWVFASR